MSLPKLDTPTYTLTLPSNNKQIVFRPFLVKEFKILLTLSQADEEEVIRVIKNLVKACTFDQIDVEKLPHFDIEFLFMNLRSKSIGENVDVILTCEGCENKYEHTFSIENLVVNKTEGHTNNIRLNESVVLSMKYPTFESVAKLLDSDEETAFNVVVNCIDGIYSEDQYFEAKDQTKEELTEFVNCLTRDQFLEIEKFFKTSPKILQRFESVCPNCNKTNVTKIS